MLTSVSGCSSGREDRSVSGIGGMRAEPELQSSVPADASIVPASPGSSGRIPVVLAKPRPFRSSVSRPGVHRSEPRRLASTAVAARAAAGASGPATAADLAEIRDMLGSYLRAFNRHDPAALVAHWSETGENVDLDSGEVTVGREAVRGVFSTLFADDATASIAIDVQSIRPVRADVAVVDGTSRIAFGDGGRSGSRFSAVVVRQDGRWMLESVREAAQAAAAEEPRPLDQLAWLVGAWEDVGPGVTASTRCFWSAGRAFLVRTHAVAPSGEDDEPGPVAGDGRTPGLLPAAAVSGREVTEIIGWDPEREAIRSWCFTSEGRFAEGVWSRAGDAWLVRFEGRGVDVGRQYDCRLVRLGADELSVRGDGGLAAALVPVCDFIRTAR
jgi:uncharacterized protein (TIGR02246 family)